MINNIIFDNGGVIVKYSFETYLDYFKFEKPVQEKMNTIFLTDEWVNLSKGLIDNQEFLKRINQMYPDYPQEVAQVLDPNNLKHLIPVYSQTVDFIKNLRAQGKNVYLLTDIVPDTIDYLKQSIKDFESLFDGIVYSCEVGMVKKEGRVFDYILDKFSLDPNETIFLDDSLTNLEQAKLRHIHTYRFLDPDKDIPAIKKIIFD